MIPPASVADAFGADGAPRPLAGGQGAAWRVGDIVLKRADDAAEAAWTQGLLAAMAPEGFCVARPMAGPSGQWVVEGWVASAWIEGLRPAAPDWHLIMTAGDAFAEAASGACSVEDARAVLGRRSHRWAVADRVAWEEADVDLPDRAAAVRARLLSFFDAPRSGDTEIVHGDLAGNVFLADGGALGTSDAVPVVLDVSPYVRPRRWAAAVVVADAGLWNGAPMAVVDRFLEGPVGSRDLLARALVFRLVAEALASEGDPPRHHGALDPFARMAAALEGP